MVKMVKINLYGQSHDYLMCLVQYSFWQVNMNMCHDKVNGNTTRLIS